MYREPDHRGRSELEADLGAVSDEVVAVALIDAAHHASPDWAIEKLLVATGDDRPVVAKAAVVGIGALARREVLTADRRVWLALFRALEIPELAGVAGDTLDDIEIYGTVGSSYHRGAQSDG